MGLLTLTCGASALGADGEFYKFFTCYQGLSDQGGRDYFVRRVQDAGDTFVAFNSVGALIVTPKLDTSKYYMTLTLPGESSKLQIRYPQRRDDIDKAGEGLVFAPGVSPDEDIIFQRYPTKPKALPFSGAAALLKKETAKELDEESKDIQQELARVELVAKDSTFPPLAAVERDVISSQKIHVEESFQNLRACEELALPGYQELVAKRKQNLYARLKLLNRRAELAPRAAGFDQLSGGLKNTKSLPAESAEQQTTVPVSAGDGAAKQAR